jgi:hypothetical protein
MSSQRVLHIFDRRGIELLTEGEFEDRPAADDRAREIIGTGPSRIDWAFTVVHQREGIVIETLHRVGHTPPARLIYDESDD